MQDVFIHETAIVEDGAVIGPGTKIWHHCHIRANAVIGANCSLGKNVFVDQNVKIGSGVKIQNNVSVYNGVIIEDDVFVGPSVVFTNDMYPRAFLEFDEEKSVTTLIKKGASLGAGSCIRCGVEISEYSMIAMGAVQVSNTDSYELWMRNPAELKGKVDKEGKRL